MRILIVKTSAFGDIVQSFPVLDYLKQRFPKAEIDWVVEEQCAELVRSHPSVSRTIVVNTREGRKAPWLLFSQLRSFRKELRSYQYDCVFDLQGNTKSAFLTMQAKGKCKVGFGLKTVREWPNIVATNRRFNPPLGMNARAEYLYLAQRYCKDRQPFPSTGGVSLKIPSKQEKLVQTILSNPICANRKKVVVCPGSAWPNKQLTEEALTRFLERVQAHLHCCFLLVWGTDNERELAQNLHSQFPNDSIIIDRMPLSSLQNLMYQSDLVIAMDSLPLHLAGTTKTPTFSVFGASSANKYQPQGPQHHALQGTCPYGRTFERRCPVLRTCPTGLCIRGLSGDEVFAAFKKSLTGRQ